MYEIECYGMESFDKTKIFRLRRLRKLFDYSQPRMIYQMDEFKVAGKSEINNYMRFPSNLHDDMADALALSMYSLFNKEKKMERSCSNCGALSEYCRGCYIFNLWQPITQETTMKSSDTKAPITNKQIVEACQEGIKNRWGILLEENNKDTLGCVSDCVLCELFQTNTTSCKECPFPGECGVYEPQNSYRKFINHYKTEHSVYFDGDDYKEHVDECIACPECERLVKGIVKDLEKIIEDHKEVEHIYSVGDVFGNIDGTTSILGVHYGNNKVGFYNEYENIWSQCDILVEDPDNIPEKQIKHLLVIKSHISGPTFKPVNRCEHGYVFGEDYDKCHCNMICANNCRMTYIECKELSRNKSNKLASDLIDKYIMELKISTTSRHKRLQYHELLLRSLAALNLKRVDKEIRKAIDILPGGKF